MAGVRLPPVPEAWLRTVAAAFSPVAEVPAFLERMKSPAEMSDESLFNLLARHPIALTALAASAGMEVVALEQRLAPLVAAGRLVVEDHHGVRMLRARSA